MKVIVFVCLLLPAARVEVLPEIALLVEKPDTHEGAQVAGRLQMVAGEDAYARKIERHSVRPNSAEQYAISGLWRAP